MPATATTGGAEWRENTSLFIGWKYFSSHNHVNRSAKQLGLTEVAEPFHM